MKKFLMLFIPILTFSFLFTTNKTYAQEYSETVIKLPFYNVEFKADWNEPVGDSYEYMVTYVVDDSIYPYIDNTKTKYFFITLSHNISFIHDKIDFRNNSYDLKSIFIPSEDSPRLAHLAVHLDKQFVNTNYSKLPGGEGSITDFFSEHSALYIAFTGELGTGGYDEGYQDGYNDGYDEGRDEGYNEGYNIGYETGQNNGYTSGYNNGYINGEQAGYSRGLDEGYANGYNTGYQLGYYEGEEDGFNRGYDEGFDEGYDSGYNNGINSHINKFLILIPSLFVLIVVITFVKPYLERGDKEWKK